MDKEIAKKVLEYQRQLRKVLATYANSVYIRGDSSTEFRAFVKADADLFLALDDIINKPAAPIPAPTAA